MQSNPDALLPNLLTLIATSEKALAVVIATVFLSVALGLMMGVNAYREDHKIAPAIGAGFFGLGFGVVVSILMFWAMAWAAPRLQWFFWNVIGVR